MKIRKFSLTLSNIIPATFMLLLFAQPITVLTYSIFKKSFNTNFIYVLVLSLALLSILRKMKVMIWQICLFIFILVSVLISNLVFVNNDIIFGLSIIIQCSIAILSINNFDPRRKNVEIYYKWFILFMVPNIIIGIAQAITGNPLFIDSVIGAQGLDTNKINNIWQFGENTRSFGLFYSNGYYALYLVGFACFAAYLTRKNKAILLATLIISATALYFTYTRTAYVQSLTAAVALFILLACLKWKLKPPIVFAMQCLCSISIFYFILMYGIGSSNAQDLSNSQSLIIRYENWEKIVNFMFSKPYNLIFGTGVSANDIIITDIIKKSNLATNYSIIVDNGYLAYVIYGGLILLFLQLFLQYKIFRSIYSNILLNKYIFLLPALVFLSSMPIYNMFGNLNSSILILSIAPILLSRRQ